MTDDEVRDTPADLRRVRERGCAQDGDAVAAAVFDHTGGVLGAVSATAPAGFARRVARAGAGRRAGGVGGPRRALTPLWTVKAAGSGTPLSGGWRLP